ncbi:retrotransposon protein, putative, ty1-copia subclass [Tanacetum coccineum]
MGVSFRKGEMKPTRYGSAHESQTIFQSLLGLCPETVARILNMVPTMKVERQHYVVGYGQPIAVLLKVWGYSKETIEDLEIIQEEDTHPSIDTSLNHKEDDLEIDESQSDINPIRRSTRTRRPTDRLCLYIDAEEHDNEVWDLVDLPPNGKTVGSKWLFKKKTDMDEAVHTYKARLVAKGYTQTSGIDYEETFYSVAYIRAIRILIPIAAFYNYEIRQMDVKTTFLNGYLSKEVYMEQPEGFVNQKYPN